MIKDTKKNLMFCFWYSCHKNLNPVLVPLPSSPSLPPLSHRRGKPVVVIVVVVVAPRRPVVAVVAPAVLVHGHLHGHEHGVLELLGRVHVVVDGRHRPRAHVLGDSPAVVIVAALVAATAIHHRLHERVGIHCAAVQICFKIKC